MKKILSIVIVILLTYVSLFSNIIAEEPTSKKDNILRDNDYLDIITNFDKPLVREPLIEWTKAYGKKDWWCYAKGKDVQQTSDGGYKILGSFITNGSLDIWIIKTDSKGYMEWNKTIDLGADEEIHGVKQTSDNGYIVKGYLQRGIWDIVYMLGYFFVKIDTLGNEQWNFTYNMSKEIDAITETSDRGYIFGGKKDINWSIGEYDIWLVKLDYFGKVEWEKTWDKEKGRYINYIFETRDDGFLIGCNKWLLKLDNQGNEEWNVTYDRGPKIKKILQMVEDEYILVIGENKEHHGEKDIWLLNIDEMGQVLWENRIGKARISSIQQIPDNGFAILGMTESELNLIKIDFKGEKEWNKTFIYETWWGHGRVICNADGGYTIYVDSYVPNAVKLIKTNYLGNELWNKSISFIANDRYYYYENIDQTNDEGYVIIGTQEYENNPYEMWDQEFEILMVKVSGAVLELNGIRGGIGVSVNMENVGYNDISEVNWSIEYMGNIWIGNHSEGTINILQSGNQTLIKSGPVWGLGWGNVTIKIEDLSYSIVLFYIGPFVFIDRGFRLSDINIINIKRGNNAK